MGIWVQLLSALKFELSVLVQTSTNLACRYKLGVCWRRPNNLPALIIKFQDRLIPSHYYSTPYSPISVPQQEGVSLNCLRTNQGRRNSLLSHHSHCQRRCNHHQKQQGGKFPATVLCLEFLNTLQHSLQVNF